MRHGFRTRGSAVELRLEAVEREALGDLLGQLRAVLAVEDEERATDPLAELVGIEPTAERPDDPALLRLLPDAYADDVDASADFRRFTERSIRSEKVARCDAALRTLANPADPGRIRMDTADAAAWLGTLNDLRLVLGTRLGITQEDEDAGTQRPAVYDWLTWLQSTLVETLMP